MHPKNTVYLLSFRTGGNELQACIESDVDTCILLPGIHREEIHLQRQSHGQSSAQAREDVAFKSTVRSKHILGSGSTSILSGTAIVPGPWELHSDYIYKTTLPSSLCDFHQEQLQKPDFGAGVTGIQQVWADIQGEPTWVPEARWPNVNLTAGASANFRGGPLSLSSWAKTYGVHGQNDSCLNCTRLRLGKLVDPSLRLRQQTTAATKTTNINSSIVREDSTPQPPVMNWTGGLLTLNVGFRFFTWTRPVLDHDLDSGTLVQQV